MEIKGIISLGEKNHITCCNSITDILIDGLSLYSALDSHFNQDEEEYWNGEKSQSPQYSLRYVILNERPSVEMSLDSKAGMIITEMMSCDHVNGCYSEYTCGYGGFDYVLNESRSVFEELSGSVGKYIHLEI